MNRRIYEYVPLQHEDGQQKIRILTLLPSKEKEAPVQCTLATVSLQQHPPYTTLSYTWGDSANQREISIGDHSLSVTSNLHEALKRFRDSNATITLWVDAICINQKDSTEKEKQVQLMRYIFRHAEQTWLWLGTAADDSPKAAALIERLSAVYTRCRSPFDPDPKFADKRLWGTLDTHSNVDELLALDHLLARDYWYRVWVVQEIAVSSEIVVSCGESSFPWDSILYTAYYLDQQVDYLGAIREFPRTTNKGRGIETGKQRIMSIQSVRNDFQGERSVGRRDSLLFLLSNHRSTEATEPKDKYIALSGLVKEEESPSGLPFYHKSVEVKDVYKLATYHLAIQSRFTEQIKPLDFLDCAGGQSSIVGLPSWVPDWSIMTGRAVPLLYWQIAVKTDENLVLMNVFSQVPRPEQSTFSFKHVHENGYLQAKGCEFDIMKSISFSTSGAPTSMFKNEEAPDYSGQDPWPYPADEEPWDIIWKTCVLDRSHAGGSNAPSTWGDIFHQCVTQPIANSNPLLIFKQWYEQNKGFKIFGQPLEEIIKRRQASTTEVANTKTTLAQCKFAFLNAVGYRKLATTSKGYLCLVPQDAEIGDTIALLFDCSVPIVLRSRGSEYYFIGTCYVHGIMNGEGADGLNFRPFHII